VTRALAKPDRCQPTQRDRKFNGVLDHLYATSLVEFLGLDIEHCEDAYHWYISARRRDAGENGRHRLFLLTSSDGRCDSVSLFSSKLDQNIGPVSE
jgi:hypothetical protein